MFDAERVGLNHEGNCGRCGGNVSMTTLVDHMVAGLFSLAFHCVLCGNITDEVIVNNRARFRVGS